MTFLENFLFRGKFKFDPSKNNFPVNIYNSCNIVRNPGIIELQRNILRYLCPQFRQTLDSFSNHPEPEIKKYVHIPCSN